ncbi:hypothetical protein TBS_30350 [Thermobispora bispora]|jgi:hypothetical protein|uniref:Uncharacterized protein n=1 Tax=Thermobispora bispora (strain ATCC 19993 / DSM 43833 / CBS 139.67 / JCM 10125 / KCTC 9307 / NBRC 14880 / R51) TaxID=469371 RepID=D6Y7H9_THEBD|nr:hypothetical protein [Thermobispora bispora]ADG89690.1 hypothetical protein Tbis_2992 [Thermobispora bispora DSM 43833]MBO2476089.1 hypothetical protein [Actinomycetales bacterium]MDI9580431.1 hypothetical protein [Thermobispora sp.]QSI49297.1 hypothetical protein CYL17_16730 [Thermobispora bispora]
MTEKDALDEVEELSIEAPEADAVEQHRPVTVPEQDRRLPTRIPFDADPADVADQEREVDLDDEDYR